MQDKLLQATIEAENRRDESGRRAGMNPPMIPGNVYDAVEQDRFVEFLDRHSVMPMAEKLVIDQCNPVVYDPPPDLPSPLLEEPRLPPVPPPPPPPPAAVEDDWQSWRCFEVIFGGGVKNAYANPNNGWYFIPFVGAVPPDAVVIIGPCARPPPPPLPKLPPPPPPPPPVGNDCDTPATGGCATFHFPRPLSHWFSVRCLPGCDAEVCTYAGRVAPVVPPGHTLYGPYQAPATEAQIEEAVRQRCGGSVVSNPPIGPPVVPPTLPPTPEPPEPPEPPPPPPPPPLPPVPPTRPPGRACDVQKLCDDFSNYLTTAGGGEGTPRDIGEWIQQVTSALPDQ
jgi:hypothetical protein